MNNNLNRWVSYYHQWTDVKVLRIVVLILSFCLAGIFLWDPIQFAQEIGGLVGYKGLLLIWGICAGVIYGIGFKPILWIWQLLFSPYISILIIGYFSLLHFIN
ncbi:cyd operon YbgE family protein [Vibrio sp. SS-MA-C1-2]|uniref:cyd operon YbgE family protein n=1 Tax=Vibrio sp. SS-MA-C1-2 TaxID=2908646 RepID=UPI001F24C73D|nr:cyd operon YbgE family protein [Vibrio sp. SS-MA-C1-2]UJF18625.1 cyd operon YbgE family protein [Vibrio sp. SS-MA-C1-2]